MLHPPQSFPDTPWQLVGRLRAPAEADRDEALSRLLSAYWVPLFTFAKSLGYRDPDAEDLVQGFCQSLIESGTLGRADPAKGRLRDFLRAGLRHYAAHEYRRLMAEKRGGGKVVSLESIPLEVVSDEAAEAAAVEFDRQWALVVYRRAMANFRSSCRARSPEIFDALLPCLMGEGESSIKEAGAKAGLGEGAARMRVHRLRAQFREYLRLEVEQTVSDRLEVAEEERYLMGLVAKHA